MEINEIVVNTLESIHEEDLDEINLEDYIIAPEENDYGNFVNLLNIFTCYYKKLFCKKETASIFEGIEYEKRDSTNRYMEFLYEEMFKYNKSNIEDKDVLYDPEDADIDINKCNELYALYVDNEIKYVSKFLLPLLYYLSEIKWLETEWNIMPLKN